MGTVLETMGMVFNALLTGRAGGGILCPKEKNMGYSCCKAVFGDFARDLKRFDWNNESEATVLDAKFFSAYRKTFVIKIARPDGRSFSFGALFISRSAEARDGGEDLVRHEFGHTDAFKKLGPIAYYRYIGRPSMNSAVEEPEYYDQPWEVIADDFGKVRGRQHDEKTIQAGYDYLNALI